MSQVYTFILIIQLLLCGYPFLKNIEILSLFLKFGFLKSPQKPQKPMNGQSSNFPLVCPQKITNKQKPLLGGFCLFHFKRPVLNQLIYFRASRGAERAVRWIDFVFSLETSDGCSSSFAEHSCLFAF